MQVLAMHAGFTTPLRSVSARPRPNRRVVTRASQDDGARPGGSASSPNRRANQKGASSPVRERSVSRAHGGTVPSAGARGDAHAKAPRLASVRDAAWSSVATGVTYGDGETRLSRAQLRAGLRARKALVKKRGALVPSASKTPPVFARDAADVDVATTSRRRRAQTFDPANNAVVKRGGETREPLSGTALGDPVRDLRRGVRGGCVVVARDARRATRSSRPNCNRRDERRVHAVLQYRDAGGEPFTVNLTNVGSPEGFNDDQTQRRGPRQSAQRAVLGARQSRGFRGVRVHTDGPTHRRRARDVRMRLGNRRTAGPACLRVALRARSERVLARGRARVAGDAAKRRALHRREGTIADVRTRTRATTRNTKNGFGFGVRRAADARPRRGRGGQDARVQRASGGCRRAL